MKKIQLLILVYFVSINVYSQIEINNITSWGYTVLRYSNVLYEKPVNFILPQIPSLITIDAPKVIVQQMTIRNLENNLKGILGSRFTDVDSISFNRKNEPGKINIKIDDIRIQLFKVREGLNPNFGLLFDSIPNTNDEDVNISSTNYYDFHITFSCSIVWENKVLIDTTIIEFFDFNSKVCYIPHFQQALSIKFYSAFSKVKNIYDSIYRNEFGYRSKEIVYNSISKSNFKLDPNKTYTLQSIGSGLNIEKFKKYFEESEYSFKWDTKNTDYLLKLKFLGKTEYYFYIYNNESKYLVKEGYYSGPVKCIIPSIYDKCLVGSIDYDDIGSFMPRKVCSGYKINLSKYIRDK